MKRWREKCPECGQYNELYLNTCTIPDCTTKHETPMQKCKKCNKVLVVGD